MKGRLEWMDTTYEAEFSVPLFDLPGRNTEVLRSLHQLIHPRFSLRTTDLHAFSGNALSDIRVRVTMLGGNGTIEVTAEKLTISIGGMGSDKYLAIGSECFALAEQALKSALPKAEIKVITVACRLSIRLGDGSIDARDFLRQVVKPGIDMELTGLGNAALYPCVNLEVENEDEGWRAVLHAYDNAVERSSFFASSWMAYSDLPEVHPYEKHIIDRPRRLLEALLQGLDVEMTPVPTTSVIS